MAFACSSIKRGEFPDRFHGDLDAGDGGVRDPDEVLKEDVQHENVVAQTASVSLYGLELPVPRLSDSRSDEFNRMTTEWAVKCADCRDRNSLFLYSPTKKGREELHLRLSHRAMVPVPRPEITLVRSVGWCQRHGSMAKDGRLA